MNESEYGKKIGFINRTSIEFNPDTLYIFGYQEGGLNLLEYDYITNVVCKRYEDEHMKHTKVYIENPVVFDDMRYIVKNQDYNKCIVTYKLIDFNSFEVNFCQLTYILLHTASQKIHSSFNGSISP